MHVTKLCSGKHDFELYRTPGFADGFSVKAMYSLHMGLFDLASGLQEWSYA